MAERPESVSCLTALLAIWFGTPCLRTQDLSLPPSLPDDANVASVMSPELLKPIAELRAGVVLPHGRGRVVRQNVEADQRITIRP